MSFGSFSELEVGYLWDIWPDGSSSLLQLNRVSPFELCMTSADNMEKAAKPMLWQNGGRIPAYDEAKDGYE
jgi:hypothetical protein